MSKRFFGVVKIFLLLTFFVADISAQPAATTSGSYRPFTFGEVLTYEGKISKIVRGLAVADFVFTFTNSPNGNDYLIKSDARSKGSLVKLFRFSFLQNYESTVDSNEFRILKTVKHDVQKDRVRNSEAFFDYGEKRVTYIERDPNQPTRPPRKFASAIQNETHDLISGIYAIRMLPLAVGKTFELSISDSGLIYKVPVRVTAREMQTTILGKIICFRLEPEVFGPNRMIEDDGKMIIWITDDRRRLPVRSQISVSIGKLDVKLKSVSDSTSKTAVNAVVK